jgi:hypothetical protein
MSIPQAVRSRLAQLLRLLLSATHPGEIVAAQGAINRTLGASGLDLHSFAGLIDGSGADDDTSLNGATRWSTRPCTPIC